MIGRVTHLTFCVIAFALAVFFMLGCSTQGQLSGASASSGSSAASEISTGAESSSAPADGASTSSAASAPSTVIADVFPSSAASAPSSAGASEAPASQAKSDASDLRLVIDGNPVEVAWEDNESVAALAQHAAEASVEVQMSPHGGFEQFGPLGFDLPSNDVQTTTEPGDIVLYTGNQIVVFYGSNSWAYTRLGKVTDKNADELADLLGGDTVTLTIERAR